MRLTTVFIIMAFMQVSASSYSQQLFTINKANVAFKKILKEIEEKSDYTVFYRVDQVNLAQKVDVSVTNGTIDEVMRQLLLNQPLSYKVIDKVIVIKPVTNNAIDNKIQAENLKQITITGTVTDAQNGNPLMGVSIMEKNTTSGTVSGANGKYIISVKGNNSVLQFQHIGYKLQEIEVGSQQVINVALEEENKVLEQVVVVGYGTQKKKDLTGSIATVSSSDLENRGNTQFGYAMEGKAAGVQVIRSSGQPQAGFSIRVRGTSSITSGSDPLYIIDGVPSPNTGNINPADIESISILKDASSAAIYGAGGSNGVVLITTKRGKNQKLKINLNASATMSSAWKQMNMLNSQQFKELATEMGKTTDWAKYTANTNWQDEIFRNAMTQDYQLSAMGGTAKTTYYLSGSYINQNGIVLNNNLNRATLKANVDQRIGRIFKVGTSLAYDDWKDRDVYENNRNGVITRLYTSIPNIGIWDPENPGQYARSPFINDLENPVSTVYEPEHLFKNNRLHGNAYAEAEILKGLKLKSLYGFERSNGNFNSFQDSVKTRYGKSQKGIAVENKYKYKYWVSENTASYNKLINDHNIGLLGGFIMERGISDNLYTSSHDFTSAADHSVSSGNVKAVPNPEYIQRSKVSYIGRLNYSYKDKYLITSNFRADGSGQFPANNKWGYFPSFSAGWRISNEEFFKNYSGSINDLKIRVGWGVFGNDRARPYAWYGLVDTMSRYLFGGVEHTAFNSSTLENTDLKWERTSQTDIGIDISFLNSRINITADYYHKKTTDLLLEVPVPTSTGFSTALQNAGSLENKGFEFFISSKNIVQKNFKWSTDFNIYTNKGKVLDIVGTTIQTGTINPAGTSLNTAIVQAGSPLGSFYGRISQGVDPATGKIKFMQNAAATGDSIGIIGNANPKFLYGFTNSFSYKKFSLDIFFQGVKGNDILNATRVLTESMALPMNQSATVLSRWKKAGDITDMPGISTSNWDNSAISTRFIEKGSYLRLKSLTLGYNFSPEALAKWRMSKFMIYFTGQNLLTFTKYTGFDPEVSAFSGKDQGTTNQNTAPGVDYGTYPQSRDYILGINITF